MEWTKKTSQIDFSQQIRKQLRLRSVQRSKRLFFLRGICKQKNKFLKFKEK